MYQDKFAFRPQDYEKNNASFRNELRKYKDKLPRHVITCLEYHVSWPDIATFHAARAYSEGLFEAQILRIPNLGRGGFAKLISFLDWHFENESISLGYVELTVEDRASLRFARDWLMENLPAGHILRADGGPLPILKKLAHASAAGVAGGRDAHD